MKLTVIVANVIGQVFQLEVKELVLMPAEKEVQKER